MAQVIRVTAAAGRLRHDVGMKEHRAWAGLQHRAQGMRERALRWRRRQAQMRAK
jgi:hypothetical protein